MLLNTPPRRVGPRELRVKIPVELHVKLHALKLLRGVQMSDAVTAAIERYLQDLEAREGQVQG